ncbi:hypothetical protein N310_02236, partial [Acanthisitta chloris]
GNLLSPSGPDSSAPALCTPQTVPPVPPSSSAGTAWQQSCSAPSSSASYPASSLLSPWLTLPSLQGDRRVWAAQSH